MEKAEKENEKTSENENEKTDLRLDESKLSRHKFERLVRIFKSGRRRRSLDTGATRFDIVDSNRDGSISFAELKSYMELKVDTDISDQDMRHFFECFSATDGNTMGLSMQEFESLMNIIEKIDENREDAYLKPKKRTINDEIVLGDRFFILSVMGMTFSSLDDIANDNKDSIDCHYST